MLIALFSMLLVGSQQAQPKAPDLVDNTTEELSCFTSCEDMAAIIMNSLDQHVVGDCTEICFTVPPGFSNCFTGYIEWGDSSPNSSLISISPEICHIYTPTSTTFVVKVIVEKKGERCKESQWVQVIPCGNLN